MSRQPFDARSVMEQVRANLDKLDGCPYHQFVPATSTGKPAPGCRWTCINCHGEVDGAARRWYEIGLKHGAAK